MRRIQASPFAVGDKVRLRPDVLMRHAHGVPAHAGFTHEQFEWRKTLRELEGQTGEIERTFDTSRHVNVQFPGVLIGIDYTELEGVPSSFGRNPSKKVRAVAFEMDGKVYEGSPGETHGALLRRLPARARARYDELSEDPDEVGFIDGFVMEDGEYLTRGDTMMRTGKPGEYVRQTAGGMMINPLRRRGGLPHPGDPEKFPGRMFGSQYRETLAQAGYGLRKRLPHGEAVLEDLETGKLELCALRDDFAGHVIEIDGKGYEFVSDYRPARGNPGVIGLGPYGKAIWQKWKRNMRGASDSDLSDAYAWFMELYRAGRNKKGMPYSSSNQGADEHAAFFAGRDDVRAGQFSPTMRENPRGGRPFYYGYVHVEGEDDVIDEIRSFFERVARHFDLSQAERSEVSSLRPGGSVEFPDRRETIVITRTR